MSLSAAVIDALVASGVSTEQLAAAMKAEIADQEARKATKRAGNAERQRRFKSKHKATPNNADNALPSVTPSPNDIYSNPQPENPPVKPSGLTAPRGQNRGARLPIDWVPGPFAADSVTAEIISRWEPGRIERELSKFRDHWAAASGHRARKHDWQAAWRTWIGNADDFGPRNRTNTVGGREPDSLLAALERARAEERAEAGSGFDQANDPGAWGSLPPQLASHAGRA